MEDQISCTVENFRPIKGTTLYRTSNPLNLEPKELPLLNDLGIRTILDFRSLSETRPYQTPLLDELYEPVRVSSSGEAGPTGEAGPGGGADHSRRHYYIDMMWPVLRAHYRSVAWFKAAILWLLSLIATVYLRWWTFDVMTIHLLQTDADLVVLSKRLLEHSGDTICFALRQLCQVSATPALLCCKLGKDRTGLVCALVQSVCGVDRRTICEDYALSEVCLKRTISELTPTMRKLSIDMRFLKSPAANMDAILQFIDTRYGSVPKYLQSIGLTLEEQEMLRRNVTQATQ